MWNWSVLHTSCISSITDFENGNGGKGLEETDGDYYKGEKAEPAL